MNGPFPPRVKDEIYEAIARLMAGVHDPKAMQEAGERMDLAREEIRRKHGIVDISVPAIRELRDE